MAEEEVKVGEVSVVGLKSGIEVEEKAGEEGDVLMNGHGDELMVNGKEDSDRSYVFVSGYDGVVDDEGLESGIRKTEVLEELDVKTESKDGEVEGLEVGLEGENRQDGKESDDVVAENGVSEEKVEVVDVVEAPTGESDWDQTMKNVESVSQGAEARPVEKSETVEELTELELVENGMEVEELNEGQIENGMKAEELTELRLIDNGVKVEELNEMGFVKNGAKVEELTELGRVENGAKAEELTGLVAEADIMVRGDQEGKEKRTINDVVESGKANLEVTDPVIGEKNEVEVETTKSNKSQLDAHDVNSECIIESSVDVKDYQESEDLVSSDALTDLVEGKETEPTIVRSDDAGGEVDESLSDEHDELDLLQPSKATSGYGSPQSDNDEALEANCTESVAYLDDIRDPEPPSVDSNDVHLSLLEQVESKLQTDITDDHTPDAECTVSNDTTLDSVDEHHKEAASYPHEDGPQLDLVTGCENGFPFDSVDQHHKEATCDIPENGPPLNLVTECPNGSPLDNSYEIPTDVAELPIYKDTPEFLIYDDKEECKKRLIANGSQESEYMGSEDANLDTAERHGKEFHNASAAADTNRVEFKEHVSLSPSSGSEDAYPTDQNGSHFPDSTTFNEVEGSDGSTTEVADEGQADDMSMPSVLISCSHPISDEVAKSTILENGYAASESGNNNEETSLEGHINTSEVEIAISPEEGSSMSAGDEETVDSEVERRPFYFLIKVPRFEDDEIREQIKYAQLELDEKTLLRDSYKDKIQSKKAVCKEFNDDLEAAKLGERTARDILKHKRKEIDTTQALIDKINNAMTLEDIESKIRSMEYKMQHETVSLSEEKQLMREIKRLKHFKGQLSSSIRDDEIQEALDQKDQIKDRMKCLKKELDRLRDDVLKAEAMTKAAKKKCFEEFAELNKLQFESRAANDVRHETYISILSLKRELAQKNKYFRMYKDKEREAYDFALSGDKGSLHKLCVEQVKIVMEQWNKNDEFRNDYIKSNMRSTLRRLKTLDGRSLGPDEEPLSVPYVRNDRFINSQVETNCVTKFPSLEQSKVHVPVKVAKDVKEPVVEVMEQKESKNVARPVNEPSKVSTMHIGDPTQEAKEEIKKTEEEVELAKKEEEMRKKEEEAKMLEQLRLEEKAKAKEAMERKKRLAEKAQARALLRAKKEAEQRERERERRQRKKEKKKTPGEVSNGEGSEKDVTFEPQSELASDSKPSEKPAPVTKRHHKPPPYTKVTKTAVPMPLPLRNRGRRKMQMWMWIGVTCLGAVAVVLVWLTKLSSIDITAGRGRFGY